MIGGSCRQAVFTGLKNVSDGCPEPGGKAFRHFHSGVHFEVINNFGLSRPGRAAGPVGGREERVISGWHFFRRASASQPSQPGCCVNAYVVFPMPSSSCEDVRALAGVLPPCADTREAGEARLALAVIGGCVGMLKCWISSCNLTIQQVAI